METMRVVDSSEQKALKAIARAELILPGGEVGKVPVQ